jgi:Immunity protein 44
MKLRLVSHLDRQCANKAAFINELSNKLENYFELKNYSASLDEFYFGIVSLSETFRELNKLAKPKYIKSKKLFDCQVEFEFEQFKNADDGTLKKLILEGILDSLQVLSKKVKGFDTDSFKKDLNQFLVT